MSRENDKLDEDRDKIWAQINEFHGKAIVEGFVPSETDKDYLIYLRVAYHEVNDRVNKYRSDHSEDAFNAKDDQNREHAFRLRELIDLFRTHKNRADEQKNADRVDRAEYESVIDEMQQMRLEHENQVLHLQQQINDERAKVEAYSAIGSVLSKTNRTQMVPHNHSPGIWNRPLNASVGLHSARIASPTYTPAMAQANSVFSRLINPSVSQL